MIDGLEIVLHVFRQAVEHIRVPALGRDVEPTFAACVQQLLVKPLRVVQQNLIPVSYTHRDVYKRQLQSGGISVDLDAHTVTANGQRVELTFKEFELLRLFLQHPGMAFTRDQLMEKVWGTDYYGETRTIDMHIRTLRQKLGPCGEHIATVRGVGYRWEGSK